jgi:hypothetical protein
VSAGGGSQTETFVPRLYSSETKGRIPQPNATLFVFALPEKGK